MQDIGEEPAHQGLSSYPTGSLSSDQQAGCARGPSVHRDSRPPTASTRAQGEPHSAEEGGSPAWEGQHPSRASASPDLLACREPPLATHSPDPLINAPEPSEGGGGRYAEEGTPLAHLRYCELYVHEAALLPGARYAVLQGSGLM